jgi:oligoendopeptidase F
MIPAFQPASDYVPAGLDARRWDQLEPLYRGLVERPLKCVKCLQRLILDRSELDAAAGEAGSQLYIDMTCHTDDPAIKQAYLDFVEHVEPRLKEVGFELDRKIHACPFKGELDQARFGVLLRDIATAVEMFRPENIPLETEATKLAQQYQELIGAMTVRFRGEEKTLPQMARYQEETDRATREEAWRLVAERRNAEREPLEALFEKLVDLRQRCARNAGFANFRDYAHKGKRRHDYTPEDCHRFAEGVERHVVPAMRRLNEQRRVALGLSSLRPWDLAVDPLGRPPLKPFADGRDLLERTRRLFKRMDAAPGGLSDLFEALCNPPAEAGGLSCLDLDSRKGKAPGGYQANRDRKRLPFIFMNAAGVQRDVETMVHEAGHAFHAMLCRGEPLLAYRSGMGEEICEVASMSMELAAHPYLDEFYGSPESTDRARRVHLEQLATLLPWIATIDQFQQWIYTTPGHTPAQREAKWVELRARFGPEVDWSGLEHLRAREWHRQLHLFCAPFYYIEYGIAQLGALQFFNNFRRDRARALAEYKRGLALGGSKPLPELYAAAGIKLDLSPAWIEQTWRGVEQVLAELPA